nr:family 20 glycosylhydrolase [Mammaliicoccus sciuri]
MESAYFNRKSFSNPYYLTKAEVKSLIKYSNDLDVMIVPDIDFPSHSKAFLSLIKKNDKRLYQEIISDYSDNTLDFFLNHKAVDVTNRQIDEIAELFHQFINQQRIVLGGDEVAGGGAHQKNYKIYESNR